VFCVFNIPFHTLRRDLSSSWSDIRVVSNHVDFVKQPSSGELLSLKVEFLKSDG